MSYVSPIAALKKQIRVLSAEKNKQEARSRTRGDSRKEKTSGGARELDNKSSDASGGEETLVESEQEEEALGTPVTVSESPAEVSSLTLGERNTLAELLSAVKSQAATIETLKARLAAGETSPVQEAKTKIKPKGKPRVLKKKLGWASAVKALTVSEGVSTKVVSDGQEGLDVNGAPRVICKEEHVEGVDKVEFERNRVQHTAKPPQGKVAEEGRVFQQEGSGRAKGEDEEEDTLSINSRQGDDLREDVERKLFQQTTENRRTGKGEGYISLKYTSLPGTHSIEEGRTGAIVWEHPFDADDEDGERMQEVLEKYRRRPLVSVNEMLSDSQSPGGFLQLSVTGMVWRRKLPTAEETSATKAAKSKSMQKSTGVFRGLSVLSLDHASVKLRVKNLNQARCWPVSPYDVVQWIGLEVLGCFSGSLLHGKYQVIPREVGAQALILEAFKDSFTHLASALGVTCERKEGAGNSACTAKISIVGSLVAFAMSSLNHHLAKGDLTGLNERTVQRFCEFYKSAFDPEVATFEMRVDVLNDAFHLCGNFCPVCFAFGMCVCFCFNTSCSHMDGVSLLEMGKKEEKVVDSGEAKAAAEKLSKAVQEYDSWILTLPANAPNRSREGFVVMKRAIAGNHHWKFPVALKTGGKGTSTSLNRGTDPFKRYVDRQGAIPLREAPPHSGSAGSARVC